VTRFTPTLNIEGNAVCCAACGNEIAQKGEAWKPKAALQVAPIKASAEIPDAPNEVVVLRHFACPKCGTLLDTETALKDDPFLDDRLF
jgi:acetone carboxylase gamma subunit